MKPRILISRSPESSGLYEAAVEKAGGEALSFHCPDPEMDFDGLILAGGGDVDPSEFGESDLGSREIDLPRDKVELALVNRCVCETHPVRLSIMTKLGDLYGQEILVNSSHHQANRQFGQGLYATAWDAVGVVEAMQHGSLPIWTVQFHPEQMTGTNGEPDGQKIFDFFLEQCRKFTDK